MNGVAKIRDLWYALRKRHLGGHPMKVLVLNGSPKGKYSITLQTVLYLQKKFKACVFEVLNVGQIIKQLEKDFTAIKKSIEDADVLLFSYPV